MSDRHQPFSDHRFAHGLQRDRPELVRQRLAIERPHKPRERSVFANLVRLRAIGPAVILLGVLLEGDEEPAHDEGFAAQPDRLGLKFELKLGEGGF